MSEAATFHKVRYRRVLSANACSFCRMLADRGAVYSEGTASFQSHDHCACTAEPVFSAQLLRAVPPVRSPQSPVVAVEAFQTLTNDPAALEHVYRGFKTRMVPGGDLGDELVIVDRVSAIRGEVKAAIQQKLTAAIEADPKAMAALRTSGNVGGRRLTKVEEVEWSRLRSRAFMGTITDDENARLLKLTQLRSRQPLGTAALTEREEAAEWVRGNIDSWAATSNVTTKAQVIQEAARDEFKLIDAAGALPSSSPAAEVAREFATEGPPTQMLLRHMYEETQARFKAEGITHVKLFRGVIADAGVFPDAAATLEGAKIPLRLRPMSSFSASAQTAGAFTDSHGGYVMTVDVPVERILCTARTGFGCLTEQEYVVLGGGDVRGHVIKRDLFRAAAAPTPIMTQAQFKAALKAA